MQTYGELQYNAILVRSTTEEKSVWTNFVETAKGNYLEFCANNLARLERPQSTSMYYQDMRPSELQRTFIEITE